MSFKRNTKRWTGWAIVDSRGRLVMCHDGAPLPYLYKQHAMIDSDPDYGQRVARVEMRIVRRKR